MLNSAKCCTADWVASNKARRYGAGSLSLLVTLGEHGDQHQSYTEVWYIEKVTPRLGMLPSGRWRPSLLPLSLQRYLHQSCHLSPSLQLPRHYHASTTRFFPQESNYRIPRSRVSARRLLFLAPIAGLTIVYLSPRPKSLLPGFFSCPSLIPCSEVDPVTPLKPLMIHSPYEQRPSFWSKIMHFLQSRVMEPLLTARRFLYLCFLFVPVLVTAPMLLIGAPGSGGPRQRRSGNGKDKMTKRRRLKLSEGEGERWGALWWYDFMVRQMQKAGPTFIKVWYFVGKAVCWIFLTPSAASSVGGFKSRSVP